MDCEEGKNLSKEKGYIFKEVSAKTGFNIEALIFKDIFEQLASKFNIEGGVVNENSVRISEPTNNEDPGKIKLENQTQEENVTKKKCC